MPTWLKVLIPVMVVVAIVVIVPVTSYISYHNIGAAAENGIVAIHEDNMNVLSNYSQRVMEAAQVPGMMRDDLSQVLTDAMSGRYGDQGSKATFQWIQENYPGQVDASLYTKMQTMIESGRRDFENNQRILIDRKRNYKTQLDQFWSGLWLGVTGYPKIALEDYEIVTSSHADGAFESGKDDGLKLRN